MFNKYQHLERLGTSAVDGINLGEAFVFPKLDGANASVWHDGETLCAGSRNRQLSEEQDNAGFYKYVMESSDQFLKYFDRHPDNILFGEWMVPHTLKTYREDFWRTFQIFDVGYVEDGDLKYRHYNDYSESLVAYDFNVVSPLAIIRNGTDEKFRSLVDGNYFGIEDGQGVGEGVVIKNYDFVNRFGNVIWAKVVRNEFKEKHSLLMGAAVMGGKSLEEKIAEKYITRPMVEKVYDKIKVAEDGWQSRFIPRLLNTVFYDFINEELWNVLKEHKNPKIDFQFLHRLCVVEIKKVTPEFGLDI